MPRHLGARVRTLSPDEPTEESATSVAIEILASISEDVLMRPSYRLRARQHLRQLRKADQRDLRADAHREDSDDEDDSGDFD
jgi:hypothetical protein